MPTLGKTFIGSTPGNFPNQGKSCCLFTLPEHARPTKFTVYFKGTDASHQGGNTRCMIYSVVATEPADRLLLSDIVNVPDGVDQWVDFPISASVDLVPGDYYLGIISAAKQIGMMDVAGTNRFHTDADVADPDDPWVTVGTGNSNNQKSIYLTYDALANFGKSDISGIEDYGNFPNADDNAACRFTLTENGTVSLISVYYQGTWTTPEHEAGLVRASIYASAGAVPSTLLGVTEEVTAPVADGWVRFPMVTPVALLAGDYFLCVNAATRKVAAMWTAGVNRYSNAPYASGQAPVWSTSGDASSPWQKFIYATYARTQVDLSVEIFGGFGRTQMPPTARILSRPVAPETIHTTDGSPIRVPAGAQLTLSAAETLHVSENAAVYGASSSHVASGGNIQTAINAANPGATITLEAGGTYTGPLTITKPLTLTTLGWSFSGRVGLAQQSSMGQIVMTGGNAVLSVKTGAAVGVTLRGVYFKGPGSDIIQFGQGDNTQTTLADAPNHCTIDQCIVEGGSELGGARRAVNLNCIDGVVTRCHLFNLVRVGQDSTGIGGWNGPGPFTITNNYINAASENIMFGGSDATILGLIPSDILIDGNTLEKDPAWEGMGLGIKNMIELKAGQRVTITNNILGEQWYSAQGYSLMLTPSQYGDNPNQQVRDVLFANNVVGPTCGFMNLLGHGQNQQTFPTLVSENITVRDNWIIIDQVTEGGQGWMMMVQNGPKNVVVEYNTVEMIGGNQWVTGNTNGSGGFPTGHILRGNLIHNYGVYGSFLTWVDPETNQSRNYLRGEHFFDYFPSAIATSNALIGSASGIAARLPGNLHGSPATYPASLVVGGYGTGTLAGYGRRP